MRGVATLSGAYVRTELKYSGAEPKAFSWAIGIKEEEILNHLLTVGWIDYYEQKNHSEELREHTAYTSFYSSRLHLCTDENKHRSSHFC